MFARNFDKHLFIFSLHYKSIYKWDKNAFHLQMKYIFDGSG